MSPATFEELLSWTGPLLQKKATRMHDPMSPSERLCATLRYLATGDAQVTIAASYRMSPLVVGRIIGETCDVLWDTLRNKGCLDVASSEREWKKIAIDFEDRWNFPFAIGAIDGKHAVMQAPPNPGSSFFNCKKSYSIVLLAICNAKYDFILVDIGDSGRQSDGSEYTNSQFGYAIENNLLHILKEEMLRDSNRILPYVFCQ